MNGLLFCPQFRAQTPSVFIIRIENGRCAGAQHFHEQQTFRLKIIFHRAVIIQMIAGQIGENRSGKQQRTGPVLVQSVAGLFHDGARTMMFLHPGEKPLNGQRIRSGPGGFLCLACAGVVFDGGKQTAWFFRKCSMENFPDQIRYRCFAVGSGYGENVHAVRRFAVKCFTA